MADNAFVRIDDWAARPGTGRRASRPTNCTARWIGMPRSAARCLDVFGQSYHWSLMQVEYATDLVFRSATTLSPLYEQLVRESVLSVKAEQVATLPRPADHAAAGPGDRLAVLHPHRGDLHQAPLRQVLDQDV